MKVTALIFVVCCLSLCFANTYNLVQWGKTNGKLLGNMAVFVPSEPSVRHVRTLAFIVDEDKPDLIVGIKHFKAHPVNITLLDNDIPSKTFTIRLDSEVGQGIDSNFAFYGH